MVLPAFEVKMSPGRMALPEGMFSTAGMIPTRLIGRLSSEAANRVPSTAAPPAISIFISSIFSAGLREMPPASKTTPLPTRAMGWELLRSP